MTADGNVTPTLPENPPDSGTIDVTDLALALKDTWIRWASKTASVAVKTAPYVGPVLSFPVLSQFTDFIIDKAVTAIANALEMQGFFFNTALRKASQAQDYIGAKSKLTSLPATATNSEYEAAEQEEMQAFRNFVMVTN